MTEHNVSGKTRPRLFDTVRAAAREVKLGPSHIARGDAARDRRDWIAAALHYQEALQQQPELRHIWIQLGHARKESGDLEGAEEAYLRAETLGGSDGEPALHMGHVAKLRGDFEAAKQLYLRAVDNNPGNDDAKRELSAYAGNMPSEAGLRKALDRRARQKAQSAMEEDALAAIEALLARRGDDIDPSSRETLVSAKALLAQLSSTASDTSDDKVGRSTAASQAIVFDTSDLLSYFRHSRLPTGIQRVQIEVISDALSSDDNARVCCFTDTSDHWIDVPAPLFLELCTLALKDGNREAPEWLTAIAELDATLMLGEPVRFEQGAFLVNLGTSWWLQNYFLFIRDAKERFGIRYVPFVHDFIPIMAPEHCVKELIEDFVSWTLGVFQHADFFLVNSQATKTDLKNVAEMLGHHVDDDRIAVIPLNADFISRKGRSDLPDASLAKWQLRKNRYVLIVSTIESRKNHVLAFDAWLELIARHGVAGVPKLVCVGNKGWLNDTVYARLQNETLRKRVVMLSSLSDDELSLLYRNCLFTIYPSLYEGWGLPVTESLCHSKVPLVSDSSSLPEAGGEFAAYFTSGSLPELIDQLESLIYDESHRREGEDHIRRRFKPRSWTEVAGQIKSALAGFGETTGDRPTLPFAFPAKLGKYHPIERNYERRIWNGYVSAEVFRIGSGWWWPDDWGCWTKPKGGRLRMLVPEGCYGLRVYFLLQGIPDADCGFDIEINMGEAHRSGTIHANEFRWIALELPEGSKDGVIDVTIQGTTQVDLAPRTGGLDSRVVSVGVAGFFLCEAADVLSRIAITEAIILRDQKSMAFNRPPRVSPDESPQTNSGKTTFRGAHASRRI
jgi:glycosyltransferase involved in cell wall biosynthesis/Flp pilus assembly protein TadD